MKRIVIASVMVGAALNLGCKPARSGAVTVEAAEPVAPATTAAVGDDPKPEATPAAAAFAGDTGSKVVARVLAPGLPVERMANRRTAPLRRRGLDWLERTEVALAPPLTTYISVPPPGRSATRPRLLAELVPLLDYTAEPAPPQRAELPHTPLIRTPSRDVNRPLELPVQSSYRPDRAALEDPAADFALQSAQSAAAPLRDKPTPFVRINLPDPFENRAVVAPPVEEPPLIAPTPQPPK